MMSLVGCKKFTCEFSYSPSAPRAGEIVTFSNASTGADDYHWSLGDNATATSNSPTHIYKKPGTYTVTLCIIRDKVQKKTCTHTITVLDTVPSIGTAGDSVFVFTPVTFRANIYNPWKKALTYAWTLPDDAVLLSESTAEAQVRCYFRHEGEHTVSMTLTVDGQPSVLTCSKNVYPTPAPSVLCKTETLAYEQRWYRINGENVYADLIPTQSEENLRLLQSEQDSVYQYGDSLLTKAKVARLIGKEVHGFQVDRLAGKLYAYGNGLWISAISGRYVRELVSEPVSAVKVDAAGNRLYWATADGVFAHRLISTENNAGLFAPQQVNTQEQVTCISVNSKQH